MRKIQITTTNGKVLKEAFDDFIRYKKISNLSSETIKYYNDCYKIFCQFHDPAHECSTITQKVIERYIEFLQNKDIVDVTINSYLRGLRAILYYFMELGYLQEFSIKLIRFDKKIKETYSNEELDILLKKPNLKTCAFAEFRNWVMINYLLGTGNRLSTMISVKCGDVDFDNNVIRLTKVKNRKEQIIPLSSTLGTILKEYLFYRKGNNEDYLFSTVYGEGMTKSGVTSAIVAYNTSRGVTKHSIHVFRHTFAKLWILNGGDIFRLQKMLGHSSIEMVKEYVNIFSNDLQVNFDQFNPLESIAVKNKKSPAIKMR